MTPLVAIVGRPNVGKSTLVNRILGRREAIVEERPGVTRDRKEMLAEWQQVPFRIVDTGGWLAGGDALDEKVSRQAERAIDEADVVCLVVDVTIGPTDEDAGVAHVLRRLDTPVIVVANKVDDSSREPAMWEFAGLGLGDPTPVSAIHGRGTGDLLDRIVELLPDQVVAEPVESGEEDRVFRVAIVGRPNAGKSTLFNRLIGDERSVVHDRAGTTRDSIDTVVETEIGSICFVDTAGMRRKARIDEDTEYYSLVRALRSVDTADVALLVVDSTVGVTHQDQRLGERVDAAGCPIVVMLNKWDVLDTDARSDIADQLERRLHFLGDVAVLRISALSGKGVGRLFPALAASIEAYGTRIPTARVNQVVRAAQSAQPAPAGGRVLYATQGATDPPTFVLFTNTKLPQTYLRYLERRLREDLDLGSTTIKLRVRRRDE